VGSAVKVLVAIHYSCQKLVHKKCSSIKGSMSKVAKSSDTRTTVRTLAQVCESVVRAMMKVYVMKVYGKGRNLTPHHPKKTLNRWTPKFV